LFRVTIHNSSSEEEEIGRKLNQNLKKGKSGNLINLLKVWLTKKDCRWRDRDKSKI
jgi:hypothetical protein